MGLYLDRTIVPGRESFASNLEGENAIYSLLNISVRNGERVISIEESSDIGAPSVIECASGQVISILGGSARVVSRTMKSARFHFDIEDDCNVIRCNAKDDKPKRITA